MNRYLRWVGMALMVGTLAWAVSVGAEEPKVEKGAFIKEYYDFPGCEVKYLKVQYAISIKADALHVRSALQWEGGQGVAPNCLPAGTKVALGFKSQTGGFGFINLQPEIPASGKGYGKESETTLKWDQAICGWGKKHAGKCFPEKAARDFFAAEYLLSDIELW